MIYLDLSAANHARFRWVLRQGCELLVFQWAFGLNLKDDILTEKKR